MSSQGLQSQVGRCEGCLPASLPASLSLHRKPSCTRLVTMYILLTLLEPSRAPGWCTVYSVTVVRRGLRQLQDQHRLCSLWLINNWPWSSRVMGEGGDNGSLCCPHPSVLKMPGNPCLSYRKFAHSSSLAGDSPCLSEMTNSRVQCPRGELKTTVN